MYLGMVLILLGTAVLMGSLTPFLVAVAFGVSLEMVFVRAEESMLERRFAGARQEYKKRVRRWI
jgi:protein-S-isoprenylcysteine O-methyltransferase Ste14